MATETERRELYEVLDRTLGRGPAETMMDLLPPMGWADVARSDQVNARFDGLRAEMRGEFAEVRGELAVVRAEMRGEFAEVRGEIAEVRAEMRGEFAEVRGELKAVVGKMAVTNFATSVSVAGLVLAAVKFF